MNIRYLGVLALSMLVCACVAPTAAVTAGGNQAELRRIQTREYQNDDKRETMRSVIATLQDLGFVVDQADYELGLLTGTRLATKRQQINQPGHEWRITVTVRERPGKRMAVRANARFDKQSIEDPQPYQDFFVALDKAMFLTANHVD